MKRYKIYVADYDDMGDELCIDETDDGEWCKYDEVDADRAKDKEEIARLKKGEEQLSETATLLAVEIARLRKAVQEIEYLADRITIENESIARAILKLAREALEGK